MYFEKDCTSTKSADHVPFTLPKITCFVGNRVSWVYVVIRWVGLSLLQFLTFFLTFFLSSNNSARQPHKLTFYQSQEYTLLASFMDTNMDFIAPHALHADFMAILSFSRLNSFTEISLYTSHSKTAWSFKCIYTSTLDVPHGVLFHVTVLGWNRQEHHSYNSLANSGL